VRPLDVDGVRTVAVGTVLWAVAFGVLAIFRDTLDEQGIGWLLWTCLAGVGLGLLGLEYTRKRRDAIAQAQLQEEADRPDELDLAEPAVDVLEPAAPDEAEPEPDFTQTGPDTAPVRVGPERPPVRRESERPPIRREPEPVPVAPEPLPEPLPVQVRPEPVPEPQPRPELRREPQQTEFEPVRPESQSRPEPEPEPATSEWEQAGLLDFGPPVPAPGPSSRRVRREARPAEPPSDLDDEPLLPITDEWRRVDDRSTQGRVRGDESIVDDDLDEGEAGYRGRRARRP
jgi:Protein of unknown function (DUF2530)